MRTLLQRQRTRRWGLQLALACLALGSIAAVVTIDRWGHDPALAQTPAPGSQATGDPTPPSGAEGEEPLEPAAYSRVEQLRRAWSLTNADLAAMGLTQAQAEAVLRQVKDWYAANAQALEQRDRAVRSAEAALREAYRRVNVGPKDDALVRSLPGLRDNVDAARQARAQLVDSALLPGAGLLSGAGLSTDQVAIGEAARANADAPAALRYASGLDASQVRVYHERLSWRGRGLHGGNRSGPAGFSGSALPGAALNVAQVQQVELAHENQRLFTRPVLAAEREVLPVPEAFRDGGSDGQE